MKREVTNYTEFLKAVNSLFSANAICDITAYEEEIAASKQRRKQKLASLSAKIRRLKKQIDEYKEKIRNALATENKKKAGIHLNQLIEKKTALLKTYKEEKNLTPFSELSDDAKIYACTGSLLNKYLFTAFIKNVPNSYKINEDQSVTVDVEAFGNSYVYQQATHIKDYVTSYIEHYKNRVKGRRYFVGLHKNAADLDDLVAVADDYFESITPKTAEEMEKLKQSHQGIEVVEIYPEHNAQAVKLLNKEALSYEGSEMKHCVSSYSTKVENKETEIYSIRDYGDETTEYVPHATIEYKDGKIKQIKGYKDSIIDMDYIEDTRCLVMKLAATDSFEDIIASKDIPSSEKINIGIVQGSDGNFYDILNVSTDFENVSIRRVVVKSTRLNSFPITKLKISELEIHGPISQKIINIVGVAENVDNIKFKGVCETKRLDFSLLKCKKIEIELTKETNLKELFAPKSSEKIKLDGTFNLLTKLSFSKYNKKVELHGDFNELTEIINNGYVESLDLEGNFNKLKKISDSKSIMLKGSFNQLEECPSDMENIKIKSLCPKLRALGKYPNLKKLRLIDCSPQLRDVETYRNVHHIDLSNGTFPDIEKMDFSSFEHLIVMCFHQCSFPNLKEIILPREMYFVAIEHCEFPNLERLDLSQTLFEDIGTLKYPREVNLKTLLLENYEEKANSIELAEIPLFGEVFGFNKFPKIKEIKLPKNIKSLTLTAIKFGPQNPLNFREYDKLTEINFSFCKFDEATHIDLSQNKNLKSVILDALHLSHITLPDGLEVLRIHLDEIEKIEEIDLSSYKCIKKLNTDFLLDKSQLPQKLERWEIHFLSKNYTGCNLRKLDFSSVKNISIKIHHAGLNLHNLESIVLAEEIMNFFLINSAPKLKEIDLTYKKGKICLYDLNVHLNYDFYFQGIKHRDMSVVHLCNENLKNIEKIKLGRDIEDLFLFTEDISPNLTVELAPDMPEDRAKNIKQKYPALRIIRGTFPPNRLLEAYQQKQHQSLR